MTLLGLSDCIHSKFDPVGGPTRPIVPLRASMCAEGPAALDSGAASD